jgi:serine-type D-Ala-D-Ala carboxypeptidase (penicillin-binding protein 5/6)
MIRFIALLLVAVQATAQTPPLPAAPKLPTVTPSAPAINAVAYVMEDFDSGQVLASKEENARVEPASITKLMTSYVLFNELKADKLKLTDQVTISERAWKMEGSRTFIKAGATVDVETLLKGMIVQSGNDAAVALAEHVAGSEDAFVSLMNQYAQRLKMSGSHFVNATGLPDPELFTTPRDIVKLARAIIGEFPQYYQWYALKSFKFNGIDQFNRNRLLWRDPSVDGMKTGHTESAGFCLVTSAKRSNQRLITVVMGTASENARADETQKLLNYGFRFFETVALYPAGKALAEADVLKGASDKVSLGLSEPFVLTLPRGRYAELSAKLQAKQTLIAPVAANAPFGSVRVELDGKVLAQKPLVALSAIELGGWWTRTVDSVQLLWASTETETESAANPAPR